MYTLSGLTSGETSLPFTSYRIDAEHTVAQGTCTRFGNSTLTAKPVSTMNLVDLLDDTYKPLTRVTM